jgi:putative phosphoribosyl transferase
MNRSSGIIFADRKDAGEQLGRYLMGRYKNLDPLVIGIPRGGVEVAYYVAQMLEAPLIPVIAKKLSVPGHAEIGFGAIAEDFSVYISPKYRNEFEPEEIGSIIDQQTDEVNRRVQTYRQGKPLPDMTGRTVIIIDDGIATGVTMIAVLRLCRKKGAGTIILAAPVSGSHFHPELDDAAAVEVLAQPEWFYAVGQVYASFREVTDEEVIEILKINAASAGNRRFVRSF